MTRIEKENITAILESVKNCSVTECSKDILKIQNFVSSVVNRLTKTDNKQNNWFANILKQKLKYFETISTTTVLEDHYFEDLVKSVNDYCESFLRINSSFNVTMETVKNARCAVEKNMNRVTIFQRIWYYLKDKLTSRSTENAEVKRFKELITRVKH